MGRKRPLKRFAFRSDFAARQGVQSCAVWSPDGRLLATGGQDGVVRVFLMDDEDLLYTAVVPTMTPGQNNSNTSSAGALASPGSDAGNGEGDGSNAAPVALKTLAGNARVVPGSVPQTPARHNNGGKLVPSNAAARAGFNNSNGTRSNFSALVAFTPRLNPLAVSPYSPAPAPPLPFVSPLFLPAAIHATPVKTLHWSPCGRALLTTCERDPEDAVRFWRAPTVEEVRSTGARIPVDYLDGAGRADKFNAATGHSAAANKPKAGDAPESKSSGASAFSSAAPAAASASLEAAFRGCDPETLLPIAVFTAEEGMELRSAVYWVPPAAPNADPAAAAAAAAKVKADVLLVLSNQRRTQKHRQNGPSYLSRYIVPHSLYDAPALPPQFAAGPPGKTPAAAAAHAAAGAKLPNGGRARGIRLSSEMLISSDDNAISTVVSPNGQFIAVATLKSLYVLTGPAPAAARAAALASQGLDAEFRKSVAGLPPLSHVARMERCFFGLPCTGMAFDPSSRVLLAVSASRGIVMVPVRPEKAAGCCAKGVASCVCDAVLCCPVWRCCVRSQFLLFAANLLLVVFLALLVQHFSVHLGEDAGDSATGGF